MPDVPAARSGLVLRKMVLSDLPDVVRIENRSFSTPWQEATFRGLLRRRSAALLAAEDAGRLVGYAVLWFAANEAELGDIAVLPEARRRGLGRWILEGALRAARDRGAEEVYLEVREANVEARRLYEKAGFETIGTRPSYYSSPVEDAILMRRRFEPPESDALPVPGR
ncbi:MAG: ribosomal protein S18-alanine N-acetyltransferase [Gemmatimonadota bacterium]|nr:ribosomal protein S18-alanine N-acetyltransferase [Gemmatimonadota bacterium]